MLTFCTTLLLMALHVYELAANFIHYVPQTDLDGFMCSTSEMVFNISIFSGGKIGCMLECGDRTSCMSTFYHHGTGRCVGCMNVYNSTSLHEIVGYVEPKPGTSFFMKHACPIGWKVWRHSCYKQTSTPGSFDDGVEACATDQGHAVRIENSMENEFLQNYFRNQFTAFMYIGYVFKISQWVYHDTEEVANVTFYAPGQGKLHPTGKDCSGFKSGNSVLWHNKKCSFSFTTLCEINL